MTEHMNGYSHPKNPKLKILNKKGDRYFFFLADNERSRRFASHQEALSKEGMDWVRNRMQAHIPHVTLREAVVGNRITTIVEHFYANCARPADFD